MVGKVNAFVVVFPMFVELTVTELNTPSGFVFPITAKVLLNMTRPLVDLPPEKTSHPEPPLSTTDAFATNVLGAVSTHPSGRPPLTVGGTNGCSQGGGATVTGGGGGAGGTVTTVAAVTGAASVGGGGGVDVVEATATLIGGGRHAYRR